MKNPRTNRYKPKSRGSKLAALAILSVVLIAVGAYFVLRPSGHTPGPALPAGSPGPSPAATAPPPSVQPPVAPTATSPAPAAPQPPVAVAPPAGSVGRGSGGQLAIVIDDMGTSIQEARSLADIGVPLTFSIIPGLRSYRQVAAFAASSNIETMIHIPMQSKGWPQRRLEANGLLVSMDGREIGERVAAFMRDIPGAVGANNHMGSEFTEHEDKMRPVLEALKGKGLYFVDSVTSPHTVGVRLARALSVRSARRLVFLDNEQDPAYIRGQLNQAATLARKNGGAIAICHPHPATISTLAAVLPDLERQGITLVTASQLVQ